jgi:PiT family inorganic phosphate transporter
MIWTFASYLLLKWFKKVIHIETELAISVWWLIALLWYTFLTSYIRKNWWLFKNSKKSINKLFNIPLIFSAALLSFAHWANDVANAIWPLAAINDIVQGWTISIETNIPIWVMIIWAIWISSWLAIFGSRLIKTVWWEITKLNQIRAYCVALAAAITVIIASWLGLPVSSTHIAIWWIFWIWLLRERIKKLQWKEKEYIKKNIIWRIVLAWVITLPVSWFISWTIFLTLDRFL